MKSSGKHVVAVIFVVLLTLICIVMEFALRLARPFSPTTFRYVQAMLENHPYFFGSVWFVIMVSAVYVAYVKYSEKKTTGKLVALLTWLAISLLMMAFWLYRIV